jgi:soluble lytic murein transglycosylase-like protein
VSLRTPITLGAVLVVSVVLLAGFATAGVAAVLELSNTALGSSTPPQVAPSEDAPSQDALSHDALVDIPRSYLGDFEAAAASCPGLSWSVLAGIGRVESDFGADDQTSSAGAEGPMQFLPATFAEYDEPVPSGGVSPPSLYDPADAIWAAARLLCANGAEGGADIPGAIYAYNHSDSYVSEVLSYAASYSDAVR